MISHEFILISDDFTWFHMSSYDFTWVHMSSFDFTWVHMISAHPSRQNGDFLQKRVEFLAGSFEDIGRARSRSPRRVARKPAVPAPEDAGKRPPKPLESIAEKACRADFFQFVADEFCRWKCVNLKDIWAAKFMLVCPTWDSCRLVPCRCALPTHTPVRQVKSRVVESLAGPEGKRRAQVQNSVRRGRISQWQHHWQNDPSEKRFLVIRKEACLFYCTVLCMLVKVCMNFWILEGCKLHENGDSQYCRPSDIPGKRSGQNSCFARSVWNVRGNIWNMEFNCQIYTSDIKRMTHGAKV